jgi:hypothetical protein
MRMGKRIDLAGQRFTRLVVRCLSEKTDSEFNRYWVCDCDCGNVAIKTTSSLTSGEASSCGCRRRELYGQHRRTHGKSRTRAYSTWDKMMQRCYSITDKNFHQYGGRGILVCERWHTFENFLVDMGQPPHGMSLDRRENDQGYDLHNCHWATQSEQCRNRRNNIYLERNGEQKLLVEWAKESGLGYHTVFSRIYTYGWDIETALTTPPSLPKDRGQKLTFNGQTLTIAQWAKHIGVSDGCLRRRIQQGWFLRDALTLPSDTHNRPVLYSASEQVCSPLA